MKKRVLTFILALALCLALLPTGVLASGDPVPASEEVMSASAAELGAPVLKKAVCLAGTGIRVTWLRVRGAALYEVLRRTGDSAPWQTAGTTAGAVFTDTDCEPGTEYTYTVRCLSADGASVMSGYDETGKTAVYLLSTPKLLGIANTRAGVKISWKPAAGAVRYQVLRKDGDGWTGVGETSGTEFTDRTACSGQEYAYTVRCVTEDGGTAASAFDAKGKTISYLAAPKIGSLKNVYGGVRLTWNAVEGAEEYLVCRRADGDAEWTALAATEDTSYTDAAAEPGTTYAYAVRAACGGALSAVPAGKRVNAASLDWRLILVNPRNPLPEDYGIELTLLSNGQSVDSRIYPDLQRMFDDMRAQGVYPIVREGFRTREYQASILQERIRRYVNQGYSRDTAESLARLYVAEPGTSEHELGLAVDINAASGYSEWAVYQWLAENAWRYGFILRYPEGKEDITGYEYEPWHYRYVGAEAAAEIHEQGVTLEEYLGEA